MTALQQVTSFPTDVGQITIFADNNNGYVGKIETLCGKTWQSRSLYNMQTAQEWAGSMCDGYRRVYGPRPDPAFEPDFSFTVNDMLLAVADVKPFVKNKPTLPVLGNFLIEMDERGIWLQGSDLDCWARSRVVACKVNRQISTTVPAKTFGDLLRLGFDKDDRINCRLDSRTQILYYYSKYDGDVASGGLKCIDAEEFPSPGGYHAASATAWLEVDTSELKKRFAKLGNDPKNKQSKYFELTCQNGSLTYRVIKGEEIVKDTFPGVLTSPLACQFVQYVYIPKFTTVLNKVKGTARIFFNVSEHRTSMTVADKYDGPNITIPMLDSTEFRRAAI